MILPSRLLVITDRTQARRPLEEIAESICRPGLCDWLLFRDKDLPRDERLRLAHRLRAITRASGTLLSVSADVELARDCEADGLHLQSTDAVRSARSELGAATLIGLSTHAPEQAAEALAMGTDYVTLSPIFATSSKPGYGPALGTGALRQAAETGIPVLALAGIKPDNAAQCTAAGAVGIAVMGEVMRADDPAAMVAALKNALAVRSERPTG